MKRLLTLFTAICVIFSLSGCKIELPSSEGAPAGESSVGSCTVSIDCKTVLSNTELLDGSKKEIIPPDGIILAPADISVYEGDTVFDVLNRAVRSRGIHMEFSTTPGYNSRYIEGIANLYAFDCGELSGWVYSVNGKFPNTGISSVKVSDGDVICILYTCDLGQDVGNGYGERQ